MTITAVAFDLDQTLTYSKTPIERTMAVAFSELSRLAPVVVVSGASLDQLLSQAIPALIEEKANLDNISLLPTSGASLYRFQENDWQPLYKKTLTEEDKTSIIREIKKALEAGIMDTPPMANDEQIEDRGTQITFSALGQHAAIKDKEAWDPDGTKKTKLQQYLADKLPNFSVKVGGSTSIDITQPGIDKAYGITQWCQMLEIKPESALYIGDSFGAQGNDEIVKKSGIKTINVTGPLETIGVILDLVTIVKRGEGIPEIYREDRPWGHFEQFAHNQKVNVKLHYFNQGQQWSKQYHRFREELWVVVVGDIEATVNESVQPHKVGDAIWAHKGDAHRIKALTDAIVLEVTWGIFFENDEVRLEDDYGRKSPTP